MVTALILIILLTLTPQVSGETEDLRTVIDITEAQKLKLSNNLPLIIYRDNSSETTVIRFFFSRKSIQGKAGLGYATTRIISSFQQDSMVKEFMESGSALNVDVRGDFTVMTLSCLTTELQSVLKIVGKMIKKPLINKIRLGAVNGSMKRIIKSRGDDPYSVMEDSIMRCLFTGDSYGGEVYGNQLSVDAISVEDIKNNYKRFISGESMVITAASDMEINKLKQVLEKEFGKLKFRGTAETGNSREIFKSGEKDQLVISKVREQAIISCSIAVEKPDIKTYAMMSLFRAVTGKGIGSRLWKLREPLNLAYDVNVKLYLMKNAGLLNCYFSTSMENWKEGYREFKNIIKNLKSGGVSAEELEKGKRTAVVSFFREKESKSGRTFLLGMFEMIGAGFYSVCRYHEIIDAVTPEEFNKFLQDIFIDNRTQYIVIGPEKSQFGEEAS